MVLSRHRRGREYTKTTRRLIKLVQNATKSKVSPLLKPHGPSRNANFLVLIKTQNGPSSHSDASLIFSSEDRKCNMLYAFYGICDITTLRLNNSLLQWPSWYMLDSYHSISNLSLVYEK